MSRKFTYSELRVETRNNKFGDRIVVKIGGPNDITIEGADGFSEETVKEVRDKALIAYGNWMALEEYEHVCDPVDPYCCDEDPILSMRREADNRREKAIELANKPISKIIKDVVNGTYISELACGLQELKIEIQKIKHDAEFEKMMPDRHTADISGIEYKLEDYMRKMFQFRHDVLNRIYVLEKKHEQIAQQNSKQGSGAETPEKNEQEV